MRLREIFDHFNTKLIKNSNYLLEGKEFLTNISVEDYSEYINFQEHGYKRNMVNKNSLLEMYIICWDCNCETKFHKHPKNGCTMKVLEGEINEIVKTENTEIINTHSKDFCSYIHDELGTHQIINGPKRSISLHIYSPPNFYE